MRCSPLRPPMSPRRPQPRPWMFPRARRPHDERGKMSNDFLGEVYINDLEECVQMYEGSFKLQPATTMSIKRDVYKEYTQDASKVFKPPDAKDQRDKKTEWTSGLTGSK